MTASRRGLLGLAAGGVAALAAHPVRAGAPNDDAALRSALDALGPEPDLAEAARALARFDPRRLSTCARLDLATVRGGLSAQARLAAMAPGDPGRFAAQVAQNWAGPVDLSRAERLITAEVARLEAQAARVFDALHLPQGPTGARFAALLARGDGAYADSDAGRDAAMADMNAVLASARSALPLWFAPLPRQCLDVAVRRMTPAELASGKGGFRVLPGDGAPGRYVVDLRDIARRPRWTLVSVVHHELLPGHMVQLPLEQAARPHPLRLHYLPAFAESWAIYAEWLGARGGLVSGPLAMAGALHWRLFRMTRALADIAVNRGQDPARVVSGLETRLGFPAYFAPFTEDVARMRKSPGLRVAEALGALAIDARARRARSLPAYHAALLGCGARPLG